MAAIRALQQRHDDPITGFYSQIAVYTHNWSKDGAPPGAGAGTPGWQQFWIDGSADGRGKVSLTPPFDGNVTAHEMGHGFGFQHDVRADPASSTGYDDYADPSCIMSQQGPFLQPPWNVAFGPALCLPHLIQKNWMYRHRLFVDIGEWITQGGVTIPLAPITRPGAKAYLGARLTNARSNPPWDYYLEYVTATEWNRGVSGMPYLLIRTILNIPAEGGDRPVYLAPLHFDERPGATAQVVEPSGNVQFTVEVASVTAPVIMATVRLL